MSIKRLVIVLRSSWNAYDMKDFANGKKPTIALRIQIPNSNVKKIEEMI
jgi:hypothetical protein